jgi:hypothetical protein
VSRIESCRLLCLLATEFNICDSLDFASLITINTTQYRRSRTADDNKGKEEKISNENEVSDLLECSLETFQNVFCNGMLSQGTYGSRKRYSALDLENVCCFS